MSNIGDDLSYKIGGAVPVWMVAGGLSFGYIIYERQKKAKAAATAQTQAQQAAATQAANAQQYSAQTLSSTGAADAIDPTTGMTYAQEQAIDPATGQTYLSEWESSNQMMVSPYGFGTSPFPTGGSLLGSQMGSYSTNGQWATAAEDFLVSQGDNPTDVMGAIQAYISGTTPTAQQMTYVNAAIQALGVPPTPVGANSGRGASSPAPAPVKSGYGYGGETFTYNGATFVAFPNDQAANDWLAKGKTIFYQPSPGVAAPWDTSLNGEYNGSPTWLYYQI